MGGAYLHKSSLACTLACIGEFSFRGLLSHFGWLKAAAQTRTETESSLAIAMGGKSKLKFARATRGSKKHRKFTAKSTKTTSHAVKAKKATKATSKVTMICSYCRKKRAVADINIESTGKALQDYILVCQPCSS